MAAAAVTPTNKRSVDGYLAMTQAELISVLQKRDDQINKLSRECKRLKTSDRTCNSSNSAVISFSPENIQVKEDQLRNTAFKGITKELKWKPSCKRGPARFSFEGMCDEPTFRAFIRLADKQTMKGMCVEFHERVQADSAAEEKAGQALEEASATEEFFERAHAAEDGEAVEAAAEEFYWRVNAAEKTEQALAEEPDERHQDDWAEEKVEEVAAAAEEFYERVRSAEEAEAEAAADEFFEMVYQAEEAEAALAEAEAKKIYFLEWKVQEWDAEQNEKKQAKIEVEKMARFYEQLQKEWEKELKDKRAKERKEFKDKLAKERNERRKLEWERKASEAAELYLAAEKHAKRAAECAVEDAKWAAEEEALAYGR